MNTMKSYLIDYAAISPDTLIDAIEYAFPKASAIWVDVDEDSFEVTVYGVTDLDVLDDILAPYIFEPLLDWDDCDYECGFDPYLGCFTDDC
jgi:hypothetical protein